jgi:hypothetical protein
MRKGTVTGEVKRILKDLGVEYSSTYSDPYGEGRVGAKFCGVYLNDQQKQTVIGKMEQQGFTYHFIKENTGGYRFTNGTRFCFSKK